MKRKDHDDSLGEDMYEESEMLEKNRLSLSTAAGSMFDSSDDDIQSNAQLERAMALNTSDHTHDFDDDDDDDDDDVDEKPKKKAPKKKKTPAKKPSKKVVSSSSESDSDDSELDTSVWGTRKADYYGADRYSKEVSSDDEPTQAADEEEEAKRLRKKQAMMLSASDFYEDGFDQSENQNVHDDDVDSEVDSDDAPSIFHRQKKTGSDSDDDDDDDSDSSTAEDKASSKKKQQKSAPPVLKEKVQKDLSALSKEERIAIVKKTSPELVQLLQEFSTNLESTMGVIAPLLERVNTEDPSQKVCTDQGLSFLETKFHLMLSYCTNISFYLLLKLSGGSIKDHPVIDQLVRLRLLIEKIRPLDAKLKYQIDKLIRLATLGPQTDKSRGGSSDPLSFRPEIDDVEDLESGGDDDNDDDDDDNDNDGRSGDQALYRPPKISMKKFETEHDKKKQREDRESRRAGRSAMMKFIQEEFGDQPESLDAGTGGALAKPSYAEESDASEEERTKFEEEYMVRLPVTRKLKKKRAEKIRQQTTLTHDLRELEDFGDIAGLSSSTRPSKPLGHVLNQIDNQSRSQSYSADADTISSHQEKSNARDSKFSKKRNFRPQSKNNHHHNHNQNNNRQKKFRR